MITFQPITFHHRISKVRPSNKSSGIKEIIRLLHETYVACCAEKTESSQINFIIKMFYLITIKKPLKLQYPHHSLVLAIPRFMPSYCSRHSTHCPYQSKISLGSFAVQFLDHLRSGSLAGSGSRFVYRSFAVLYSNPEESPKETLLWQRYKQNKYHSKTPQCYEHSCKQVIFYLLGSTLR